MKKGPITRQIFIIFVLCVFVFTSFAQEKIQEEVKVNWWVVPLFVVDKGDNPVLDLKKNDIELKINRHRIKNFILIKRDFQFRENTPVTETHPLKAKKKIVFLLFDTAFSSKSNLEKSKYIAKNMVQRAEKSTLFVVMIVHPYDGLVYLVGPKNEKLLLLKTIEEKVKWAVEAKSISKIVKIVRSSQMDGWKEAKYTNGEMWLKLRAMSHSLKNTNQRYFKSFLILYYALNSMSDNKFVYFFTEGISLFARKIIPGSEGEYRYLIREAATSLSNSGAVLFIVNPAGAQESSFLSAGSGEDSMRYFVKQSGGRYLEGEKENIANRIETMHRAYYEIAFPELAQFKGTFRKISIQSKRPGITIHSLTSLEKQKFYTEMKQTGKEIFALNIIYRNPFFNDRVNLKDVVVKKSYEKKKKKIFQVLIPQDWLGDEIDLYKAWVNKDSGEVNIQKNVLILKKKKMKIEFKQKDKTRVYFALINPGENKALVKGIEVKKGENSEISLFPEIKPMSEKSIVNINFVDLLEGAGNYCERLKKSVFHYICKERVTETFDVFKGGFISDISFYENRASDGDMVRRHTQTQTYGSKRALVRKTLFDYQLIHDRGRIKEQRKLLSKKKKKGDELHSIGRLGAFLAEKAVFAPLTLLGKERQILYDFKLIKFENLKGSRCAVIETIPKLKEDARYVYGQLWIRTDDYSVLKIKANPRSIKGFQKLHSIARNLMSKLFLDLEISFNHVHKGIRFPSKITLKELYKGGPHIIRYRGSKGWLRNHTVYTYYDYRFFKVDVDVTEE